MKLGILGTGMIVKDLLTTYSRLNIEYTAILGTKNTQEETEALANQYHLDKCYYDYDKLLQDENIDTVYVALPNFLHYSFSKKAIEHHKNVIIEKPITANVNELKELMQLAKDNDVLMVEAMNIHYLPAYQKLKQCISKIGQIKIVSVNYSQYSSRYNAFKAGNILPAFDYHKAGGALMDLNVYNIHGLVGLFGQPEKINYMANIEHQIDTSGILTLDYQNFKAVSIGAKDCKAPVMLTFQGDNGVIKIDKPINQLTKFEYINNNNEVEVVDLDDGTHRLFYEFEAFIKMIDNHDVDQVNQMLQISLTVSNIMNVARNQEGIVFDNDR